MQWHEWINPKVQYVIQGVDTSIEFSPNLAAIQNECVLYLSMMHSCRCGCSGSMPGQSVRFVVDAVEVEHALPPPRVITPSPAFHQFFILSS